MQQVSGVNWVAWVMAIGCIFAIAFMLRFLFAMISERRAIRSRLRFETLPDLAESSVAASAANTWAPTPAVCFSRGISGLGADLSSMQPVAVIEISGSW